MFSNNNTVLHNLVPFFQEKWKMKKPDDQDLKPFSWPWYSEANPEIPRHVDWCCSCGDYLLWNRIFPEGTLKIFTCIPSTNIFISKGKVIT